MEKAARWKEYKGFKKRKMKVDKRQKMKYDSLEEMSNKVMEEERIPLCEVYKRIKMSKQKIMLREEIVKAMNSSTTKDEEEIPRSPSVKKVLGCDSDGYSERLSESESEENIRRSPVEIKGFSYYFDTKVYGDFPEDEVESEEDVFGDSDRYEVDHGFNFVVKKKWMTVTNPKVPLKTYFKSDGSQSFSIFPALHHPDFPLAQISKLALKTYNTIQNTKYEYVGLVKAYQQAVNGFHFWTRFKARLRGQDAINFQAITFQGRRHRKTNVVHLQFESVYPLPPS